MKYRPEELAGRLKVEGEAVMTYFRGLTPDQWNQDVYHAGGVWKVRDVLAHFIAAEQGFHQLIQDVSTGGAGAWQDFNTDEFNYRTVQSLRTQDLEVLLGQYAMVRERTTALVLGLSMEQLALRGRHPALGEAPLDEIVRAIYHHNTLHLRDVRQAMKAPGAGQQMERGIA